MNLEMAGLEGDSGRRGGGGGGDSDLGFRSRRYSE